MASGRALCYTLLMAEARAWHQREKESIPAYAAFMQYLLLGENRSLSKLAQTLRKNKVMLSRWCSKHEWVVRVAAYEEHYSLRALDAVEDERIDLMRQHLQLATSVLSRARARLEYVVEQMPEPTGNKDEDRRILDELQEQGRLMSIDQAIRAGDLAVKVGRLATGLDGKFVPQQGGSTDLSGVSVSDLEEMERILEKAKEG
jgi:hypothetical protein